MQRKLLRGTHLPVQVMEIQAGYLQSPHFKDLYQYLLQNKLLSSKSAIKKLEALSEKYVLSDSNMFYQTPYYSEYIQKKRQQFWQYQKHVQTR